MNNLDYECIIVGSGIAGITAAIYLKRYNIKTLLLEHEVPGGQIIKSSQIENYPGFNSMNGAEFSEKLYNQIKYLDIDLKIEKVISIENNEEYKIVKTKNNNYKTQYIILATGRKPNKLNIENEEELIGKGISYCATCDGMFFKDKDVVIVGGGNSALEETLFLSKIVKNITIINRSDKLKADKILQEKVNNLPNVKILYNKNIKRLIQKNELLDSIELDDNTIIKCEGLFIYIGLKPKLNYLDNLNIEMENNYIIVNENKETSIKGIYAVGDIIKKDLYQLITAASDGAIAANSIKNIRE